MIEAALIFLDSGLCLFSYNASEQPSIRDDMVTNLLTALAMFAKEVINDEVSTVQLRGHTIIFQKKVVEELAGNTVVFALIDRSVDVPSSLTLGRLRGLLARINRQFTNRAKNFTPHEVIHDKWLDRFVKGEVKFVNKELEERPDPEFIFVYATRARKSLPSSQRIYASVDLLLNTLMPAFHVDVAGRKEGELHYIYYGSYLAFQSHFLPPKQKDLAEDLKTATNIPPQDLWAEDPETTFTQEVRVSKLPETRLKASLLEQIQAYHEKQYGQLCSCKIEREEGGHCLIVKWHSARAYQWMVDQGITHLNQALNLQ